MYIEYCVVGYPFVKLSTKTLYMKVLDYDRFSRDDPIGEICVPLCDVDLANGETLCREIQSCKGSGVSSFVLLVVVVTLSYLLSRGHELNS